MKKYFLLFTPILLSPLLVLTSCAKSNIGTVDISTIFKFNKISENIDIFNDFDNQMLEWINYYNGTDLKLNDDIFFRTPQWDNATENYINCSVVAIGNGIYKYSNSEFIFNYTPPANQSVES